MDKGIINGLPKGTILHGKTYDYEIIRALGQGSFGITYLASVKMRGELGTLDAAVYVAIKEFFMHEVNGRDRTAVTSGNKEGVYDKYKAKFIVEARNLARLKHQHIIKVMEAFEENNTVYYSMEYLSGGSLDDYIMRKGHLAESEALGFASQIASALSFMHSQNMVHLDLKPSNVMLQDGRAVLIDFGLSKQFDKDGKPESSTTIGAGTPGYAPVEQANYQGGAKGGLPVTMDIYALGATLFKMLVGHRPPVASDILNEGFPENELKAKNVSRSTQNLVTRAMSPLRKERTSTATAFLQELEKTDGRRKEENTVIEEDIKPEVIEPSPVYAKPIAETEPAKTKPVSKRRSWVWLWWLVPIVIIVISLIKGLNGNSVDENVTPVSGTINGHEYVDLGLSVKWATCNVGASSPSDYGDYFAWGETTTKSEYTRANSVAYEKSMGDISGDSRYDAARANWGGTWRLPTKAEIDELVEKCTCKWTTQGEHNGCLVTGPNGNSIFLPAAGTRHGSSLYSVGEYGYYWSSTSYDSYTQNAYYLRFCSDYFDGGWYGRDYGHTVRPVSE